MSNEINRRNFLGRARDLFAYKELQRLKGLEYFFAASAGIVLDVSFNSLISQANASERTNKQYEKPKEWTRIEIDKANFSEEVFPKKLEFAPGKTTIIVSAVWQTAALYDSKGNLVKIGGNELKFLASTGKVEYLTELGVYQIQSKKDKDHRSIKYKVKDAKGNEIGAPMPFAKHLGKAKLDEYGKMNFQPSDGTAIHARNNVQDDTTTSFMSHGCIGLPYSIAKDFHNRLGIGDQVVVIGEKMPTGIKSIEDIVKKLGNENSGYIEYMNKEVKLKPQEVKEKKQCFIYCSATGQNIFDFMSEDPGKNPLRDQNGNVRIPQTGPECIAVRKAFYEEAARRCQN